MSKTDKSGNGGQARSALATPTDLSENGVKSIAAALNGLGADAFALYVKTKNFHWHMSGPHFRDYHLLLDEQERSDLRDDRSAWPSACASSGRPRCGRSGISPSCNRSRTTTRPFVAPLDMLRELAHDNRAFAASQRKAHELCDDNSDVASASLLEVWIDEAERRTWFLFEASRPPDQSGH